MFSGLVTRFPLVFGVLAAATFFTIAFFTVAALLLPTIEWRLHRDYGGHESEIVDSPKKPNRKSLKRFSRSRSDDEKHERKPKLGAASRSRSSRSSRTRLTVSYLLKTVSR